MAFDVISTTTLLKSILDSVIDSFSKFQTTPKRKVAKELLAVSQTLEDVEGCIAEIISSLDEFVCEKQVGMRVHQIHRVGKYLRELQLLFRKFSIWVKKGRGISGVNMFSPSTMESLRLLNQVENAEYEIESAIDNLAKEIQAVRSPNPANFPKEETIIEFRRAMGTILLETKHAREELRLFVTKHFSLEDLF